MIVELKKDELNKVQGGAISMTAALIIVGIAIFVIGVIDGITRPKKCN